MKPKNISIYDTTLRDGSQTVGISFSVQDKINIAKALDQLKIDYIEGGWPGSNPKDDEFFKKIKNEKLKHSKIVAFGSTKRPKVNIKDDPFIKALLKSKTEAVTIVAKTWDFHVTKALGISLDENLNLIHETITYLKKKKVEVLIDAEHFFDGYKSNVKYSRQCLYTAYDSGADMIVLCDTNGGTLPHETKSIIEKILTEIDLPIGVHFHNDSGVAVANSLISVLAGVKSVQGTINGYGERCGNCDLMTLIPNISTKLNYTCQASSALKHFTRISKFVSETANFTHDARAPFVGDNAFVHKGGIHVSALQKDPRTYEHLNPTLVGNQRRIIVSELSGKSNIEFKSKEMGFNLDNNSKVNKKILSIVKSLEDQGYQFEAAEGSLELIIRKNTGQYLPFFKLKGFRVITEMDESQKINCEATIKVEVNEQIEHTAANGNGPVEALDNALRKALTKFYPQIKELHLSDYKVRVLNEKEGTGSSVRVLIDQKVQTERWATIGVSSNIIEASWQALVDGIEYMLLKKIK